MKYLILFGAIVFTFQAIRSGREKLAFAFIVAALPFEAAPFKGDSFLIGLNGFLIWSFWFAYGMKHGFAKIGSSGSIAVVKKYLLYFLVAGIVLAIFTNNTGIDTAAAYTIPVQVFNFSLIVVTLVMFLDAFSLFGNDPEYMQNLMLVFVSTSIVQLISVVSPVLGYEGLLPAFLISNPVIHFDPAIESVTVRYTGLIADYDIIIDYALMVMVFSVILISEGKKIVPAVSVVSAVVVGLMSGTRSFIVGVAILVIAYLLYYVFLHFNSKRIFGIVLVCVGIIIVGRVVLGIVGELQILDRFDVTLQLFSEGDVAGATNRQGLITNLGSFLAGGSVLGRGALFFDEMNGDELVSHNLLFAAYAKYGIIGIIAVLALLRKTVVSLYTSFSNSRNKEEKAEAMMYSVLFVLIFMQSMKVSPLRYLSSVLLHAFAYMMIYFFSVRIERASKNSLNAAVVNTTAAILGTSTPLRG